MLESLIESRNSQTTSQPPFRSEILSRQRYAIGSKELQARASTLLQPHRPSSLLGITSLLDEQNSPMSSLFIACKGEPKLKPSGTLNFSLSDLKNELLLRDVKDLLSKGELARARQSMVGAMSAGLRLTEPLLKLYDALSSERVVTQSRQSPRRNNEATWIKGNRSSYRGKWVAVLGENVVASGDTFKEFLAIVRQQRLTTTPILHHVE